MQNEISYRFKEGKQKPAQREVTRPQTKPASKLAMRLALAYYVERCVENGTLESYADAARQLGITRARMTQVMDLMMVPLKAMEQMIVRSSN